MGAAAPERPEAPVALAADIPRRAPATPTDVSPGGAPPAERPRLVAPAPEPAVAQQDPATWRRQLSLRRPYTRLVALPAASVSTPTAYGAERGQGFVGFAYQARTRFTDIDDGAAVLAAGIGDRQRAVALELALTSYSTLRGGGPLETGGLSFKLHRALNDAWGVAVGMENAASWGGSDAGHSPFAVVTRAFRLRSDPSEPFSAATASLGVGAGRFRSEQDVVDERETVNVFGSLGLQVLEPVSVAADWTGQDLFAGVSVTPSRRVPIVLNAGFADLTRNAGDGPRFILSAGFGFRYLPPFF